jgi:hypothetical protein
MPGAHGVWLVLKEAGSRLSVHRPTSQRFSLIHHLLLVCKSAFCIICHSSFSLVDEAICEA